MSLVNRREPSIGCMEFVAGVAVLLSIMFVQAWFEANAFNKATGKNMSVWDALFTELRVTGEAH